MEAIDVFRLEMESRTPRVLCLRFRKLLSDIQEHWAVAEHKEVGLPFLFLAPPSPEAKDVYEESF